YGKLVTTCVVCHPRIVNLQHVFIYTATLLTLHSTMNSILTLSTFLGASLFLSNLTMAQNRIEFKEFELDNGLTVLMHRDNTTPIVALSVLEPVRRKSLKRE